MMAEKLSTPVIGKHAGRATRTRQPYQHPERVAILRPQATKCRPMDKKSLKRKRSIRPQGHEV